MAHSYTLTYDNNKLGLINGYASSEQVKQSEEDGDSADPSDNTPDQGSSRSPDTTGSDQDNNSAPFKFKRSPSKKKRNKLYIGLGLGGLGLPLILLVVFILFFSQLKAVHFETVMRSAGFAQFQLTMNKAFSQVLFDRATLTDTSTGRLTINKGFVDQTGLVTSLTKARLQTLGNEDKLKFDVGDGNVVNGIEVGGKSYNLNDYAQRYGTTWDSLTGKTINPLKAIDNARLRATIRTQMANDIRAPLAEVLANDSGWYRSLTYNGLRKAAGIEMVKWLDWKQYIGKTPKEAIAENANDETESISEKPISDIVAEDSATLGEGNNSEAEAITKAAKDAATLGAPTNLSKPSDRITKINGVASNVSLAVFGTTLACIVNDLDNSFQTTSTQDELGALRTGHLAMTGADQTESGQTVTEAVNAENQTWSGAENSVYYKQDTGQTLTAADQAQIQKLPSIFAGNPFTQFIHNLNQSISVDPAQFAPGLNLLNLVPSYKNAVSAGNSAAKNAICPILMNQYVQGGIAVGEIGLSAFTAGGETLAGLATIQGIKAILVGTGHLLGSVVAGDVLGYLLDQLKNNVTNTSYTGVATGSDKYDQSRAGVNYLEQVGMRSMGFGAPLSPQDSAQSQVVAMNSLKAQNQHEDAYQRYFALSNPFSLMSTIVGKMPSSFAELGTGIVGFLHSATLSLMNPMQAISSLMASHVSAATTNQTAITGANVGVVDFGYTQTESSIIDNNPDAFNYSTLQNFFTDNELSTLDSKYGATPADNSSGKSLMNCYTPPLQSQVPADCTDPTTNTYKFLVGDCATITDASDCKDSSGISIGLKWRWYNALLTADTESQRSLDSIAAGT